MQTDKQEIWFSAAKNGNMVTLQQAWDSGIDINVTDHAKNTALHLATQNSQLDVMSFLIDHGADLNLQNDKLSTPLHLTEKNMDAIRVLLEAGANPNILDADYDYPYYFAFYGSMTRELAELYIKHGANLQFYG